jgi:ribosomal protein S18 acetylase RimI-like enzyme
VIIREAKLEEIGSIASLEKRVWKKNAAPIKNIASRIKIFPKGNLIAVVDNEIVGYVSTVIINEKLAGKAKTWYEFTDNGLARGVYDPGGSILFGINLTVDKGYRNKEIGSKLLLQIARMAIENNLKYGMLGGRLPYYYKYKNVAVRKYVKMRDKKGQILDPELRLYRRLGLKIVKVKKNYFKDPESQDYGVILEWRNPFYSFTKVFPFLAKPLSHLFRIWL